MKSQILTTGLLAAGVSAAATEKRACSATAEWPGFAGIKHAFVLLVGPHQ